MLTNATLRRLNALPALLASLVLIFWPVAARANCCCRGENQLQCVGEIDAIATSPSLPACCSKRPACCADKSKTPESSCDDFQQASSCCPSAADGTRGCGTSDDCQCKFRCSQLSQVAFSTTVNSDSSNSIAAVEAHLEFLLPRHSRSESSNSLDLVSSLPAQDHCALLCRWLK